MAFTLVAHNPYPPISRREVGTTLEEMFKATHVDRPTFSPTKLTLIHVLEIKGGHPGMLASSQVDPDHTSLADTDFRY